MPHFQTLELRRRSSTSVTDADLLTKALRLCIHIRNGGRCPPPSPRGPRCSRVSWPRARARRLGDLAAGRDVEGGSAYWSRSLQLAAFCALIRLFYAFSRSFTCSLTCLLIPTATHFIFHALTKPTLRKSLGVSLTSFTGSMCSCEERWFF